MMHSSFNFGNQLHQCFSSFQNQRCVHYPTNNLRIGNSRNIHNQPNRSFASVVGYPFAQLGDIQIVGKMETSNPQQKTLHQHNQYQYQAMMGNKEFHDFQHMPTMATQGHPPNPDQSYQKPQKTESFHNHIGAVDGSSMFNPRSIVSSFLRNYHKSSSPQKTTSKMNQPYNRNNNFNHQNYQQRRKPHSDSQTSNYYQNSVPKNFHKKDRSNIERVIHEDVKDLRSKTYKSAVNTLYKNSSQKTANDPSKCKKENPEEPPFLLYSLDEFPAIVNATNNHIKLSRKKKKSRRHKTETDKKCKVKLEDEFVIISSEASVSTPPFEPPKISLCEKIIRSPKKLLMTTSRFPLKPILKLSRSQRRSVSECSDDWIQFDHDSFPNNKQDMGCDDDETDNDDDVEDEDEESEMETDEETEEDDESDEDDSEISFDEPDNGEDKIDAKIQPLDSGFEDKKVCFENCLMKSKINFSKSFKVRFNTKPKVHVMRVWDYAYRSYRKGDYWQQFARDNERFKKRIQEQEKILAPILNSKHRERILSERFSEKDQ